MSEIKKQTTFAEHIAQLQESARTFQKLLAPLAEMQQKMEDFLRPFIEAQERLQESVQSRLEMHQHMSYLAKQVLIPENLAADLSRLVQPSIEFRNHLEELISPAFKELAESFEKITQTDT